MLAKSTVVIGFIGSTLDQGRTLERWQRWRPTISLCMHEDFIVNQMVLLHDRQVRLCNQVTHDIAQVSPQTQVTPADISIKDPWDFAEVYGKLYDWVKNYKFDTTQYDYYLHITTGTHVVQICWYLLVESNYLPARLLQSSPFEKSPEGKLHFIDLDLSRYDGLRQRFEAETQENWQQLKANIATQNPAFNRMIEQVEQVATRSVAPILLMGATGVGKSHLAQQVFELKKDKQRLTGRFVDVNCATLRGDSATSALFGHIKGAFTGAANSRAGLLKSADGGLLFLDEIGELGLDEQAMLLKALEDKSFFPVGSDKEVHADFQLIAGTNRDLRIEVREGRFREDLWARLNTWTFVLPALKDRVEDIEPNLQFELARFALQNGRQIRFHREALATYMQFARTPAARWSGNFRDLTASLTRMATLSAGGRITTEDVAEEITRLRHNWQTQETVDILSNLLSEDVHQSLDEFDRIQLIGVIEACKAYKNMADAGRALFAVSRTQKDKPNDSDRLRKYLARFGLSWDQLRDG